MHFRKSTSRLDELLRRVQPFRPEKARAGNYVLSGPITALKVDVLEFFLRCMSGYGVEVHVEMTEKYNLHLIQYRDEQKPHTGRVKKVG